MESIPCSCTKRLSIVKLVILSKAICTFSAILIIIKITMAVFTEIEQLLLIIVYLKFYRGWSLLTINIALAYYLMLINDAV